MKPPIGIPFVIALTIAAAATVRGSQAPASPVNRDKILADQVKDEGAASPAAGRPIYQERCAVCHRFGAIGTDVGPDLTTISSRFKKTDILDSILWPSKVISDQYQPEMFELTDGKVVTGLIVRETAAAVLVRTPEAPEKPVAVPKAQIANRAVSTVSMMPEGLIDTLSHQQIADLVAFMLAPPPDK